MDSKPGFTTQVTTEEVALFATGPDNNHQRLDAKGDLKSTNTDSGNTPTTTLRGGMVMGMKDSDGMLYPYSGVATDGTQKAVGILPKHTTMLDRFGTVEDKMSKIAIGGIFKSVAAADLIGVDLEALATLFRIGFTAAQLDPHGSAFGVHFKARYFKTADYTILAADHGCEFVAITNAVNFTLPDLATVGRGFQVFIYNAVDASMVITGAADTIVFGDAGGALSTTLTFSTANKKMGGQALMTADYGTDGTTLMWYPKFMSTVPVSA